MRHGNITYATHSYIKICTSFCFAVHMQGRGPSVPNANLKREILITSSNQLEFVSRLRRRVGEDAIERAFHPNLDVSLWHVCVATPDANGEQSNAEYENKCRVFAPGIQEFRIFFFHRVARFSILLASERELQPKLHVSCGVCPEDFSQITVVDVLIRIEEVHVVEEIESFPTELEILVFGNWESL